MNSLLHDLRSMDPLEALVVIDSAHIEFDNSKLFPQFIIGVEKSVVATCVYSDPTHFLFNIDDHSYSVIVNKDNELLQSTRDISSWTVTGRLPVRSIEVTTCIVHRIVNHLNFNTKMLFDLKTAWDSWESKCIQDM